MNTDNLQGNDAPTHEEERRSRIEDLPASDNQILAEERERPSVQRAPPIMDEERQRHAPPGEPEEPEDLGSPSPGDPEE